MVRGDSPQVEQAEEFETWIGQVLDDAKKNLNLTDETIVWVLLKMVLKYYFRTIARIK